MCVHKFCLMTKATLLSPITHLAQGLFFPLLTRGHLDSRVTHEGTMRRKMSLDVLFLGSPLSACTHRWRACDSYLVTLADACLLWYASPRGSFGKRTICPTARAASLHCQNTHTYTHTLPIIPGVLHWRSTVFPLSRWAGRTKGHVLLTIWEWTHWTNSHL